MAEFQSKRLDRRAKVNNKSTAVAETRHINDNQKKKIYRFVRIIKVFEYFVVRKKSLSSLTQRVMTRQVCLTIETFGKSTFNS